MVIGTQSVNPYPAKLIYLNFQPLEVVHRYRNPQLQVAENYSYLFNLKTNIDKSWCLDTHFIPNKSDLVDWKKQIKNDNSHDQQDRVDMVEPIRLIRAVILPVWLVVTSGELIIVYGQA